MHIGVGFPQTEIGNDPAIIRDYAQTAESLGYQHLLTSEHIMGADTTFRPDWGDLYTAEAPFHEPFVLFGFLAGFTSTLELVTGILILPQRETALVAKQAAAVDVLTGGRLTLGIGVGYNEVEYEAVGASFKDRGRRIEEQIEVLRRLWAEPVVDFEGKWHRIKRAGINPLPHQRHIRLIMGGNDRRVLARAARMADGWFPSFFRHEDLAAFPERLAWIKDAVAANGRDPRHFEIRAQIRLANKDPDDWGRETEVFRTLGVDYLTVNTMRDGLRGVEHIEQIERYMTSAKSLAEPAVAPATSAESEDLDESPMGRA